MGHRKEVTASDEILSEIHTFYSKRFERKSNSSDQDCLDYLCSIETNSLSDPDAETCDGLIKVGEIQRALTTMANNKTKEFYSRFISELSIILVECYNASFNYGELTNSQSKQ